MKTTTVLRFKVAIDDDTQLREAAQLCRLSRNAGSENWLLRQRGLPESEKQSRTSPKPDHNGNAKGLSESTKIYHAITAAAPTLNTSVAAKLAAEVNTLIAAKVDWRKQGEGKTRKRADAILGYEDRPPFFTSLEIPILNTQSEIEINDGAVCIVAQGIVKGTRLEIPIGWRGMKASQTTILREMADGTRRQPDAKLLYKQHKSAWYLHVPVQFETERRSDIGVSLYPVIGRPEGRSQDNFLRLIMPDGKPWHVGHGGFLITQTARLIGLRKQIGWRYRFGQGAGHGRSKIDAAIRTRWKQQLDIVSEVMRRAINDLLRQCDKCGAGVIIYREPSLPLREKSWFAASGLEWDWTAFQADLVNVAASRGIEVRKKLYKIKDAQADGQLPKKQTEDAA